MTPDTTRPPGSLTVPPLFGWEGIVVLLVATVAIGVGYLVLSALSASREPSADWDAWLQGRSRDRHDVVDVPARPAGPHPGAQPQVPAPDRAGEPNGARRSA